MKTETHNLTTHDVNQGRAAVQSEIAEAQAAFDTAAFNAAADPSEENRDALAAARSKVENLKAEAAGLEGVEREVKRREQAEARASLVDELAQAKAAALAYFKARDKAMTRVGKALDELEAALLAEQEASSAGRENVQRIVLITNPRGFEQVFQQVQRFVIANPNPTLDRMASMFDKLKVIGHPISWNVTLNGGARSDRPHDAAKELRDFECVLSGLELDEK